MAAGDVITNIYDPNNGKLQYEFIKHADGSYTVWQYDTENQYTWNAARSDFTSVSKTIAITLIQRDGIYVYETFDLAHGDALQVDTTDL